MVRIGFYSYNLLTYGSLCGRLCDLALPLTVLRRAQLKLQYCILAAMILHIDVLRFDWVHILVSSNEMTELLLVELAENLKAQVA